MFKFLPALRAVLRNADVEPPANVTPTPDGGPTKEGTSGGGSDANGPQTAVDGATPAGYATAAGVVSQQQEEEAAPPLGVTADGEVVRVGAQNGMRQPVRQSLGTWVVTLASGSEPGHVGGDACIGVGAGGGCTVGGVAQGGGEAAKGGGDGDVAAASRVSAASERAASRPQ